MTTQSSIPATSPAATVLQLPAAAARSEQLTHHSTMREFVFEHMLLGQLGAEMLARDVEYDVLRSEVDKEGFDILLETGSIARHTQLKVTIRGGKRGDITVSTRLSRKPSACVIWLTYDPDRRDFCSIRWFGNAPGHPLPDIGERVARHSRANSKGEKAGRPNHRVVAARRFKRLDDIGQLVDRLFGMQPATELALLRSHLVPTAGSDAAWTGAVANGDFGAIPANLTWYGGATELAHLTDGYRMLKRISHCDPDAFLTHQRDKQQLTGHWPGDAVTLWTTLFLEARADHFGSNDFAGEVPHLDLLCRQLRHALIVLKNADA